MDDVIQLKFLFANKDGVKVTLGAPRSAHVADVKAQLLAAWPADVPKPECLSSIRLICMGLGALQDNKTLSDSKVPSFPTHPTPVNVSVVPPKRSADPAGGSSEHPLTQRAPPTNISCWCSIS
ncbi:hypothetical protein SPRG_11081 [Saprolegnia parasitica CBS 223.65]|uniref:UBL3-like ubiquitin domain-containing protein n=1 Tax=Saprolegnia parasitica (strain CBS 223.65) TaxID=695850 RepID=A0A067C3D4_SAPPC|nr:hypothetical protein SPRG_11081 [Saprolegnia parasitica CBS 223.65]KDO23635.1 hypothetical protein SPRG_11081 [Saprolegnia parasitica CBS 223.65]|eukprot:XP_012205618.1 hypothetical protein SPRG_11081 [Saprolegnia parasitica CBS 223.65]